MCACTLLVCTCVAGRGQQATMQETRLTAPQTQEISFTFGLGSAEFYERYGNNAAAIEQFTRLMQRLAETPTAHIDSIVVTAFSTTSEQLGTVELAEQRVEALQSRIKSIIRQSPYAEPVIVTDNVVARNNIFSPDRLFTLLKQVHVTVYLNGVLMSDSRRMRRVPSAADEERRYLFPFGHDAQMDVFGHYTKQQQNPTSHSDPKIPNRQPATIQTEMMAATTAVPPTTAVSSVASQPINTVAEYEVVNRRDPELQGFIDSLARAMETPFPIPQAKVQVSHIVQTETLVVTPPPAPVITAEEPCPEACDPTIAALIRNMLTKKEEKSSSVR